MVAFALIALKLGSVWEVPAFLATCGTLIAITAVDLDRYLIPKKILYPGLFLSCALLVASAVAERESSRLLGATIGGSAAFLTLLAIHLVSPRGMGFGDVRLAGLIGVTLGWLGIGYVAVGIFLSFLMASVVGLGLMALGRRGRKDRVPFGPFLAMGWLVSVLGGAAVIEWYTTLSGG